MHNQQTQEYNFLVKFINIAIVVIAITGHHKNTVNGHLSSLGRQQDLGKGIAGSHQLGKNSVSDNVVDETGDGTGGTNVGEILVPKSFPMSAQEPSCDELRMMWRFSKRQSRAAEITNEIPTYRDPFTYNVWQPYYPSTRSFGGSRMLSYYRDTMRPIYGRILHREPMIPPRITDRNRVLEDMSRVYGSENKATQADPRRRIKFRFSGSTGNVHGPNGLGGFGAGMGMGIGGFNGGMASIGSLTGNSVSNLGGSSINSLTTHQGSFQKLKELIWTERAKELSNQRKAEELAARAAVLKEIANGQRKYNLERKQQELEETPLMNENRTPEKEQRQRADDRLGLTPKSQLQKNQKTSAFSSNPAINSNRSGGLVVPNSNSRNINKGNGSIKNPPMRPSHFRERNRALYRQPSPASDYFQRETRKLLVNNKNNNYYKNQKSIMFDNFLNSYVDLINSIDLNNLKKIVNDNENNFNDYYLNNNDDYTNNNNNNNLNEYNLKNTNYDDVTLNMNNNNVQTQNNYREKNLKNLLQKIYQEQQKQSAQNAYDSLEYNYNYNLNDNNNNKDEKNDIASSYGNHNHIEDISNLLFD